MKHVLVILFFLLLYSFSVLGQDSLRYSNNTKLTWEHFKGVPKLTDTLAALITTTIQMKIDKISIWTGYTTFSAWSIMYPTKTWVKKEYMEDHVLNHEQLHFDISELVAKRLEAYINKQRIVSGDKKKAAKIFDEYYLILIEIQDKYDEETSGGNNQSEQVKWNDKIRNELKELEKGSMKTAKKH